MLNVFGRVLSAGQLHQLREHKYRSQGVSVVEQYCLRFFWDWLVARLPLWLAPNLITLVGLCVSLGSSVVLLLLDPALEGRAPRWSYAVCALGMFIYQTLDGIDGKQARRTGNSNPLGEFFDHGCDAVMTFVYALVAVSCVGLADHPLLTVSLVFGLVMVNYTYHWQTYVCGVLHFKQIDTQEALLLQISLLFMSAILGPEFWQYKIPAIGFPLKAVLMVATVMFSVLNICDAFSIILTRGVGKNGSTVADTSVLSPILTPLVVVGLTLSCLVLSPTPLHSDHPALFLLVFVFPASKMVIYMMLAGMTRHPYPLLDSVMLYPLFVMGNSYFGSFFPDNFVLISCALLVAVEITSMFVTVCQQMSESLGVACFTIPHSVPPPPSPPHSSSSPPSPPHSSSSPPSLPHKNGTST